jgi:hypothetical protein
MGAVSVDAFSLSRKETQNSKARDRFAFAIPKQS